MLLAHISHQLVYLVQVDLEMSFVQAEGVMALTEDLVSSTLDKTVPHLKIPPRPFPQMPYKEAMSRVRFSLITYSRAVDTVYPVFFMGLFCGSTLTCI